MKALLSILFLSFLITSAAQVKVGADGAIHPTGSYPATSLREAKAYALTVKGIADRDAIPANYRDTGMMVLVRDSGYIYSLVGGILDANWTLCALAASPIDAQFHTAGYGLLGSPYNGNTPQTWIVDTSVIAPTSIINIITGSDTVTYIVDSIANAPLGTEANNTQYLVGTSPSGTFAAHANQVAKLIGGVWNYTTPTSQQQLIVDNALNYASYQYSGTYPSGIWKQTSILVKVGGNKTGAKINIGTKDNKEVLFIVNNHEIVRVTLDSTFQYTKFKGQDSSKVYFTVDANGKQVLGHFTPEIVYVDSVFINGSNDSLIVFKNGNRYASKLPSGGGSGTVTSVATNTGSGITGGTITTTGTIAADTASVLSTKAHVTDVLQSYVPSTRTISTTAPLTGGGDLSANRTLAITQATTSTNGYLSSTDWNTFNGKQAALTLTTTGSSGAATLVGATLNIPQYSGGGSLTISDSVIVATAAQTAFNFSTITTPTATKNVTLQVDGIDQDPIYWSRSSTTYTFTGGLQVNQRVHLRVTQ